MKTMKRPLLTSGLLVVCVSASLRAQEPPGPKPQETRDDVPGFLAEGGVANVIEGSATYFHGEGTQPLHARQKFRNNDEILVGENGRVEILLNPGSYLRLFSNSRIRFIDLGS